MESKDGGGDVFGCGHLEARISPGSLLKVDGEGVTFGQAGQFRGITPVAGS